MDATTAATRTDNTTTDKNLEQKPAYPIRVTNHNKIKYCVSFALDFFDKNEDVPIVLHTLPFGYLIAPEPEPEPEPDVAVEDDDTSDAAKDENGKNSKGKKKQENRKQPQEGSLSTATTTIPRLISVVEIIKREFIKNLALKHSPRLAGLHQYTEIGCLEDLLNSSKNDGGGGDSGGSVERASRVNGDRQEGLGRLDERAKEVTEALSGRNQ
ncbi:hypothetical protein AX17_003648 [Amanita inopinata Kibby_2008]|nr:hypothetical protein AX17_003648 [Amanita inopinata Kibby_2008]